MLLHEAGQDAFSALARAWGAERLGQVTAGVGLAVALGLLATTPARGRRVVLAWIGAAALGVAVLAQIGTEAVHLAQYGLLAALGLPFPTLLLLGVVDEGWQWVALYPYRSLDWNDVVLNALGSALGAAWRAARP